MYTIAKLFQAAGLTIILVGFIRSFPDLMSHGMLATGLIFFMVGWVITKFFLKA